MNPKLSPGAEGIVEDTSPVAFERRLQTAEGRRLTEDASRKKNWKRWGPYLSERQWATVRED